MGPPASGSWTGPDPCGFRTHTTHLSCRRCKCRWSLRWHVCAVHYLDQLRNPSTSPLSSDTVDITILEQLSTFQSTEPTACRRTKTSLSLSRPSQHTPFGSTPQNRMVLSSLADASSSKFVGCQATEFTEWVWP